MTTEQLRALGRRFFESQDARKGGADPAIIGPGYQALINTMPIMDAAGHDGMARAFYAGFPDGHHEIEQIIAEGDRVAVRFIFTGTHSGAFFGVPASGKRVAVPAHVFLQVKDDKVISVFGLFDQAGLMQQIGAA